MHEQWEKIDKLNKKFGKSFRLFKGTECDILPDGSLDYPDDVLAGFDYVVASVHSNFKMSREEMTARIVKAVSNPRVTMLGHPTGRLLLARDSYAVDLDAVIDAAAKAGTMIEINANPHRLDIDAVHCRRARQKGVQDRHQSRRPRHRRSGRPGVRHLRRPRRAWLTKTDVFNTAPVDKIARQLEKLRAQGEMMGEVDDEVAVQRAWSSQEDRSAPSAPRALHKCEESMKVGFVPSIVEHEAGPGLNSFWIHTFGRSGNLCEHCTLRRESSSIRSVALFRHFQRSATAEQPRAVPRVVEPVLGYPKMCLRPIC